MNIIDLDLLVPEPLRFKVGNDIYEVPSQPEYRKILEFANLQQKLEKSRNTKEQEDALPKVAAFIFNLDPNKEVTTEFMSENFSVSQLYKIITAFSEKLKETSQNPN